MWRKILKIEIWAQERQTIPRAFVYEQSVEGEHFTYSPQASVLVLSLCAHIYAYKFVCVIFYLVGFTSVLTDLKWTLSDVFNRDILFYESCKITLKSHDHLFLFSWLHQNPLQMTKTSMAFLMKHLNAFLFLSMAFCCNVCSIIAH